VRIAAGLDSQYRSDLTKDLSGDGTSSLRRELSFLATGRMIMKWILVSICLLVMASISPASAKGCIKGAIVGGVVGHMAGHGKVGAAAGCAIGHHEANKPDPNNSNAQAPSGQK
jgi:hypothetical protein